MHERLAWYGWNLKSCLGVPVIRGDMGISLGVGGFAFFDVLNISFMELFFVDFLLNLFVLLPWELGSPIGHKECIASFKCLKFPLTDIPVCTSSSIPEHHFKKTQ